ncbi:uncharacterized protein LOC110814627 isoform X2 [Carica papaya]|uniref:uncharacterized protein LOC110814627 isoform X2 n=1 Tax=Carica papaya TaxID=3649 RepID=UPI000B8C8DB8|nr:uncharacterized protein LOC110814627 isoform X2 [Carica papaya]
MASANDPQELHFSGFSDNRKKLDGFPLIDAVNPLRKEAVMDLLWQKENLPSEAKYDLRKSLAWDSAFFTNPGVLDREELFETLNFLDVDNTVDGSGQGKQKSLPSVSVETEISRRIGDCNVRRSLAWDSAFFTNPGVLDPEELSLVNNGYKKSDAHILPEIEEFWRSADSNSTVDSGSYSLANLEIDLFDDIRESANISVPLSSTAASNVKPTQGVDSVPYLHDAKKALGGSALRKMKSVSSSRRQNTNKRRLERTSKETSLTLREQHAARSGESKSFSSRKPPKISNRTNAQSTAPLRDASLGANNVEIENKDSKVASGQNRTMQKKLCLADSSSLISSATLPRNSPFSGSLSIANESAGPRFSAFGFSNVKSTSDFMRRKAKSRLAVSDSTFRTPLRNFTQTSELVSSGQSNFLLSTPKSSCASLAISTDGWSSESSSSGHKTSSTSSLGINPSAVVLVDTETAKTSDSDHHYLEQPCINKSSQEISPVPANNGPRHVKPSGLRLPSPKIGFFDTGNSGNGVMKFQSGVESVPRSENNVSNLSRGTGNRRGFDKQRASESFTGSKKHNDSQQNEDEFRGSKATSPKASTFSTARKSNLLAAVKAQNDRSFEQSNGKRLRAADLVSSSKAENKGTQRHLKNKMNSKSDRKVYPKPNKQALRGPDNAGCMSSHRSNLHILHEEDKENLYEFKNRVDDLIRRIEIIDFNGDPF